MNLYEIKHTRDEYELCSMEMKYLFHTELKEGYIITEDYIDVNRSPFVKYCIKDVITTGSLEELINVIHSRNISYEDFKVKYFDIEGNTEFNRRHEIEGIIGYEINGYAKVGEPNIILGVTKIKNTWFFGEYIRSSGIWREHNERPQQYCNALTTRISRAIVNIVVGNDLSLRVIDPCCGIGTVVMEALSMGIDIVGFDINPSVVEGAKRNLKYFDYHDVINEGNVHNLTGEFDVSIVDLPYGILSITSRYKQLEIIKSAGRISKRAAIISVEGIEEDLISIGYKIQDMCIIAKGKFKRYLFLCEKTGEK